MATKLHGMLNLSRIPKEMIVTNKNGESVIWVDIMENKNGADQYGNTHSVSIYNKETKQAIYLGNFKPQEFSVTPEQTAQTNVFEQPTNVTEAMMGNVKEALEKKVAQNASADAQQSDLPF